MVEALVPKKLEVKEVNIVNRGTDENVIRSALEPVLQALRDIRFQHAGEVLEEILEEEIDYWIVRGW